MTFQHNDPFPPIQPPQPDVALTCVLYPEEQMFLTTTEMEMSSIIYEFLMLKVMYGHNQK